MELIFFQITYLIISIFSALLAFFIYKKGDKSKVNITFVLLNICVVFWSFGRYMVLISTSYETALFWTRIFYYFSIILYVFFLHFIISFLNLNNKRFLFLSVFYLNSLILIVINTIDIVFNTNYFISDVSNKIFFAYYEDPGLVYIFQLISNIVIPIYTVYELIVQYNKTDNNLKKNQIKYILYASILGFFGGGTILFLVYDYFIAPYGIFLIIIQFLVVGYVISRYRFMGIRVIFSKIYFYSVIAIFLYIVFYSIAYIESIFLGGIYTTLSYSIGVLFAFAFAVVLVPLLNKVQKSSDYLFYKGYNPRVILKDLVIKFNSVIRLDEVLAILSNEFKKILEVEDIGVLIFQGDEKDEKECTKNIHHDEHKIICVSDDLYKVIMNSKDLIVRDELDPVIDKKLLEELDKDNLKIIAPLIAHGKLVGAVLMGEKVSQDAYTKEDFEFLEVISSQAATAVENAKLYKEVEDFSMDLRKKVNEQTKDIKEKAERLQKLLAMKSEFLDIASHQLRTPVSIVKSVLSMLLEGSVPKDRISEFYESAFQKSIKLEETIDEILRASEMDSDKFMLDLEPTDLKIVLKHIYNEKLSLAEKQGLKLIFDIPEDLPMVMTDAKYIKHIINNLINNSLQYTEKGEIRLKIKILKKKVKIMVSDTGIGVPEADIPKLFQKFTRAKNAIQTYTDGSGLGLFIAKKVMEAHPGGSIKLEKTEVGKGATFTVELPLVTK